MAAKRSRIGGSYADSGVVNQLRPPAAAPSALAVGARSSPAALECPQFRQGILTLSPPQLTVEDVERQVPGNFLEKCWYCHKKIAEDKDVFMYCHFRAFCSQECRDVVIEKESALEKVAKRSSQIKAQSSTMNNSEGKQRY